MENDTVRDLLFMDGISCDHLLKSIQTMIKKTVIIALMCITVFSCTKQTGMTTSSKNQMESVKANRQQKKGLRKASLTVNKRLSEKGY